MAMNVKKKERILLYYHMQGNRKNDANFMKKYLIIDWIRLVLNLD